MYIQSLPLSIKRAISTPNRVSMAKDPANSLEVILKYSFLYISASLTKIRKKLS